MSGSALSDFSRDPRDPTTGSTSASSSPTEDAAASLRAAALLTLKSKRRKVGSVAAEQVPALASRPVAGPPSIQLDYGEEPAAPGSTSHASLAAPPPSVPSVPSLSQQQQPQSNAMDVDHSKEEGEIEEGEISESGSTPPAPTPKLPPGVVILPPINLRLPPTPPQAPINLVSIGKKVPVPIQTEAPASPPSISSAASSITSAISSQTMPPPPLPYIVDENHVRPGLQMTQAQFDQAKDDVLDLLGWGVPPEYLVNCGLSRQIVYYVFVELNLRLPQNLDTSGIVPYSPHSIQALQLQSANLATSSDMTPYLDAMSLAPKPSGSLLDRLGPEPPTSHLRQTPEPVIQRRAYELSATASPFVPTSPASTTSPGSDPALTTMEAARRQELLARKAVLASKKQEKHGSSPDPPVLQASTSESSETQDVEMAAVPRDVDEFLKSIETAGEISGNNTASASERQPLSRIATIDDMDMDMDEEIPGLQSTTDTLPSYTSLAASRSVSSLESVRPTLVFTAEPLPMDGPRSAGESSSSGHATRSTSEDDMDAIPGFDPLPRPAPSSRSTFPISQAGRRAGKRPVAADFDDMSPGPSRMGNNGHGLGHYHGSKRRKNGGFAGLSGARRCVIDLSDSESESEDVASGRSQALAEVDAPRGYSNGRGHMSTAGASPNSSAPTPNILAAKEAEIRKMRELIAQREQTRLKKLVAASANTSISSTPPPTSANVNGIPMSPVNIKREEEDSDSLYAQPAAESAVRGFATLPAGSAVAKREADIPPLTVPGSSMDIPLPESASTTSGARTPVDIVANAMEHPSTGDRVFTAEAQREQVVYSPQSPHYGEAHPPVGASSPHVQASAQDQMPLDHVQSHEHHLAEETKLRDFDTYHSLLDLYPTLRSSTHSAQPGILGTGPSLASPNTGSKIDLKPLKTLAMQQLLGDPARRICRYEIPGGGECRDRDCEDLHLSRLPPVEPSDEETAQYLCAAVCGFSYSTHQVRLALETMRAQRPTKAFDDRVAEALTLLGVR